MILRDDQWEKLEPLMLGGKGGPGIEGRDNRLFIEAILWHISGQCGWSELPSEFGKWTAIYMRFKRWNESGYWHRIVEDLTVEDLNYDKELSGVMKRIAAYADKQTQSTVRRKARAAERVAYKASITHIEKETGAPNDNESDSHWLSLVGAN
ncbi:transposase [Glaciimonas soli]|nr:transposase [Glaciimonas soli]